MPWESGMGYTKQYWKYDGDVRFTFHTCATLFKGRMNGLNDCC